MLDIPSTSAIIAAVGVLIGVVFTYLEVRNLTRQRQTDLVMRLYSTFGTREFQEAWTNFMSTEFKDCNDYLKRGGVYAPEFRLIYEGIGVLLHRKLIDISLVDDLFSGPIMMTWEKMKPLVEGARKHYDRPQFAEYFEHLYNKMQKREQQLAT